MVVDKFLQFEKPLNGGIQKIYKFENEMGASVVRHYGSYGGNQDLWELAVIKFEYGEWDINYNTPVTSDVLGYLSWEEVEANLHKISKLEKGVY